MTYAVQRDGACCFNCEHWKPYRERYKYKNLSPSAEGRCTRALLDSDCRGYEHCPQHIRRNIEKTAYEDASESTFSRQGISEHARELRASQGGL